MKDVTGKPDTLREATAEAFLRVGQEALDKVRERAVEKGDVLESSRLAAILGVKKTPDVLPWCHPLPVGGVDARAEVEPEGIRIRVTVRTVAPTGVEMEALTGASVAALNAYDMLKPHTGDLVFEGARLVEKKGGKGDFAERPARPVRAGVVVLSDSVAAGRKEDRSGLAVRDRLLAVERVEVPVYEVLPDEPDRLRRRVEELLEEGIDLLVTVGGTGLWRRDRTVEALEGLIERPVPGIMEAARAHGQRRTPYAMLSRGIAGIAGGTLILTLPGSTRGAGESLDALLPGLLHGLRMVRDPRHEGG